MNIPLPQRKPHTGGRPRIKTEHYEDFYRMYNDEGKSMRDIAKVFDVSVGTVFNGVSYVRDHLAKK